MGAFIIRRLGQAVLTVLGVMLLTFLLFRVVAGDVSAQFVNIKLGEQVRQAWLAKHGYDRPMLVNMHRRLYVEDRAGGDEPLMVRNAEGGRAVDALALAPMAGPDEPQEGDGSPGVLPLMGRYVFRLSEQTPLADLTGEKDRSDPSAGAQKAEQALGPNPGLIFQLSDGTELEVDLSGAETAGELIDRIKRDGDNGGRLVAGITDWSAGQLCNSQFFMHLWNSATFRSRSLVTEEKLLTIVARRGPYSLALTVPAMAIGWLGAMVVSCLVAYYHGTWIDRLGVFGSVLGMCIPFLAYMIIGQWLMFQIHPPTAWGLRNKANIYVPVIISVLAGLGASVRFYRTVILDEVGRDYVRTAMAKGVPLPGVLFRHVLKNAMLPILTNLVAAIPFLIMGSLLLEQFFGIPGLGSLMINSISARDVPVVTGLTFLTAVVYTLALLVTDILYAVFDPRIRLR